MDWTNKEAVTRAVAKKGDAIKHASNELKGDKEVVMAAVAQNGRALEYASDELKENKEVVMVAVARGGRALRWVSHETTKQLFIDQKRKREDLEDFNKRVKVRVNELEDQLEDAQDLNECLVQSENNKMTEIDTLKQQMQTMQRRIDELENNS